MLFTKEFPKTITCPCELEKAWFLFKNHGEKHPCGEACTDSKCRELRVRYERLRADPKRLLPAIYFSLLPFKNEETIAPWKRNRYWAVIGDVRIKSRLWVLCEACAKDVEIHKHVSYHPNGYQAEWRRRPKSGHLTLYFPREDDTVVA